MPRGGASSRREASPGPRGEEQHQAAQHEGRRVERRRQRREQQEVGRRAGHEHRRRQAPPGVELARERVGDGDEHERRAGSTAGAAPRAGRPHHRHEGRRDPRVERASRTAVPTASCPRPGAAPSGRRSRCRRRPACGAPRSRTARAPRRASSSASGIARQGLIAPPALLRSPATRVPARRPCPRTRAAATASTPSPRGSEPPRARARRPSRAPPASAGAPAEDAGAATRPTAPWAASRRTTGIAGSR